jgi:DNA-binding transcriptional MerR regulator
MSETDRVYSPEEFAQLINRSVSTLKRWATKKWLEPSRYPSGRPFYTPDHLDLVDCLKQAKNKKK